MERQSEVPQSLPPGQEHPPGHFHERRLSRFEERHLPTPTVAMVGEVIDLLLGHRVSHLREMLGNVGEPRSGKREVIGERVFKAHLAGLISAEALSERLNQVEGWGRQRISFFKLPQACWSRLKNHEAVKTSLVERGFASLLEGTHVVVIPRSPTLVSVRISQRYIRFTWASCERKWVWGSPEGDPATGRIMVPKTLVESRGISWLEVDLLAEKVLISLPHRNGEEGEEIKMARIRGDLDGVIDLSLLETIDFGTAIKRSMIEPGLTCRRGGVLTKGSAKVQILSPDSHTDLRNDGDAMEILKSPDTVACFGTFIMPKPGLKRGLGFHMEADSGVVSIAGEHSEQEVRNVVSRIYSNLD